MEKFEAQLGKIIQGKIPLVKKPFGKIGAEMGLAEREILNTINKMMKDGTIRKFGAILRHQKAGYTRNAMVLWAVPAAKIEEVGKNFSLLPKVTHCYERTPAFEGKYNLFTMVHFQDQDPGKEVEKLVEASGIEDYKILESLEEFKKSSMEYF
jgi:DNA-binding Lrp family transcriptional regulator